jgi:hypothetical protein
MPTATGDAFDTYSAILQGTGKFLYKNKCKTLAELDDFGDPDDPETTQIAQFTVVDMDTDGTPEVILEYLPYGNILVLHFANGIVYGYQERRNASLGK